MARSVSVMPQYKDVNGEPLDMEQALTQSFFNLAWSDGPEVECTRRGFDEVWSVHRQVDGLTAGYGTVTRVNYAFRRNGSSNDYNAFDEAARVIIEPV